MQLARRTVLQGDFGDCTERAERDLGRRPDIGVFLRVAGQNLAVGGHQFDLRGVMVHGAGVFARAVGRGTHCTGQTLIQYVGQIDGFLTDDLQITCQLG